MMEEMKSALLLLIWPHWEGAGGSGSPALHSRGRLGQGSTGQGRFGTEQERPGAGQVEQVCCQGGSTAVGAVWQISLRERRRPTVGERRAVRRSPGCWVEELLCARVEPTAAV